MKSRSVFLWAGLFTLAGCSLRAVMGLAPSPENSKSLWFGLPAFLVFLLFVTGICSWGAFIRKRMAPAMDSLEALLFDLATGSVLAYAAAYVLTPTGLFSASRGVAVWVLLGAGFGFGIRDLKVRRALDFGRSWYSRLFMFLIPLMVLVKLIEGLQFHQHGDAYVTYLSGPRMWGSSGRFDGFLRFSQFFLSTSWESLFAWGTVLMGFEGGRGLDVSQWFSQWVTGGIGFSGAALAGLALCRRFPQAIKVDSAFHPVIVLIALQLPELAWTQNLAKNDFGIVFWGLSAFYFSLRAASISPLFAFFPGLIGGAAVVGKFTLAFFAVLIGLSLLLQNRKAFFWFVSGGVSGAAPVLIRNFIYTDNPVFPWLPNVFHSTGLSDFARHGASAALATPLTLDRLPGYLSEFPASIPLIWCIPVLFFFPQARAGLARFLWVPVFSCLAFTLTMRPSTGLRYQNAALVLLALASAHGAFFLVQTLSERGFKRARNWAPALLAFVLLAKSNLTLFTLAQIGKPGKFGPFSPQMEKTIQIGGPAKVWIRSHLKPTESILSFGDVHVYYLIDYALTDVASSVEYGNKLFKSTLEEAGTVLKNAPFDFLYLAGEDYYKDASFARDQAKIEEVMRMTAAWNQKCKPYDSGKAQVWDLRCLRGGT